ncbi:hypothetical protein SAMN05518849_12845 [Sphingobium sp. AP50]|uniref:hypothetical protein n=1 Tax=Sphingobium sp. AP50 TaxID=1884369 RepID=UPI0008B6BB38|nr:hypothetical protein [Sphingobium sp. AP50]SEK02305.1 hypothetical protein SAMN05518849_12845 [Sphingobium sp. AP50]
MTLVAASTAWEECRAALAAAILKRFGDRVSGTDWTKIKPGAGRPDGFGSSGPAWHATLDDAQDILTAAGYTCSPIDATEIAAVLSAVLTKSTRLLFDHITIMRPFR